MKNVKRTRQRGATAGAPRSALFLFDFPARQRGKSDGRRARGAERHPLDLNVVAASPKVRPGARYAGIQLVVLGSDRLAASIASLVMRRLEERVVRHDVKTRGVRIA